MRLNLLVIPPLVEFHILARPPPRYAILVPTQCQCILPLHGVYPPCASFCAPVGHPKQQGRTVHALRSLLGVGRHALSLRNASALHRPVLRLWLDARILAQCALSFVLDFRMALFWRCSGCPPLQVTPGSSSNLRIVHRTLLHPPRVAPTAFRDAGVEGCKARFSQSFNWSSGTSYWSTHNSIRATPYFANALRINFGPLRALPVLQPPCPQRLPRRPMYHFADGDLSRRALARRPEGLVKISQSKRPFPVLQPLATQRLRRV